VLFGRTNFISPIYVEPLHARAAYEMGDPNIDDANHDLLVADHPRRGQVDAALSLLDDPGVSAEVHRLRLLDREHCRGIIQELNHCLDMPLGPSNRTAQQQENDTRLMEERVRREERRQEIAGRLVAAAAMSRLLPILYGIYGREFGNYPAGMYLTRRHPAVLWRPRGQTPPIVPVYVPPSTPPHPTRPHHATTPSPTDMDAGSVLFEDNADGEV
jgi:hypothetical protein